MKQIFLAAPRELHVLPDPVRASLNLIVNGFDVRSFLPSDDVYQEHVQCLLRVGVGAVALHPVTKCASLSFVHSLPYPYSLTYAMWALGGVPKRAFRKQYYSDHRRFLLKCGIDIAERCMPDSSVSPVVH